MSPTFFDCNSIPEDRRNKIFSYVVLLILRFNDDKKPIWYGKIRDTLVLSKMNKNEFHCVFNYLEDTAFIYGRYCETEKGRAGVCWYIHERHIERIRKEIKEKR